MLGSWERLLLSNVKDASHLEGWNFTWAFLLIQDTPRCPRTFRFAVASVLHHCHSTILVYRRRSSSAALAVLSAIWNDFRASVSDWYRRSVSEVRRRTPTRTGAFSLHSCSHDNNSAKLGDSIHEGIGPNFVIIDIVLASVIWLIQYRCFTDKYGQI